MATETVSQPRTEQTTAAVRTAAAAAILFAAALFACVARVNMPADTTDAELLAWWQNGENRSATVVSTFAGIAAAVFFAVVANHLRSRHDSPLIRFGHSMATAFSATLLATAAVRGVFGFHGDQALPGVDVLRYNTSLGYTLLDIIAMTTLALAIGAFAVAVVRERFLGRWVGVVGIVATLGIAGAIAATVGAYAIPLALLWAVALAVAILRRPTTTSPA